MLLRWYGASCVIVVFLIGAWTPQSAIAQETIKPASTAGNNIVRAANFIQAMGNPAVAHEIRGNLFDPVYSRYETGDTGKDDAITHTGRETTFDPQAIAPSRFPLPSFDDPAANDAQVGQLIDIAALVFHENYHFFHTGNEYDTWKAEVLELDRWVHTAHERFRASRTARNLLILKLLVKKKIGVLDEWISFNCNESGSPFTWLANSLSGVRSRWKELRSTVIDLQTTLESIELAPTPSPPRSTEKRVGMLIRQADHDERYAAAEPIPNNCSVGPSEIISDNGFYLGGELAKNWGGVRSTERFAATDTITNQFSDHADPFGGGLIVGYKFAPWANNVIVSPFASFDFLHAPVNHTFAGGSFLGTTANFMGTAGVKVGPQLDSGPWLYGIAGASVLNERLNINFIPAASSTDAMVAGATLGLGGAWQPAFLQGFGRPVSLFVEYQHTWWQDANFNTPAASPLFNYAFARQDDVVKFGFTVPISAPAAALPPPIIHK